MKRKLPPLICCSVLLISLLAPLPVSAQKPLVSGAKLLLEAGKPPRIIPPTILPANVTIVQQAGRNATRAARKQNLDDAQLQRTIVQQLFTPPTLTLTPGYRNGVEVLTLPKDQLTLYLNYALSAAPISFVHQSVRQLQAQVDNTENFFESLAKSLYYQHFTMSTPHVRALFARVAQQNDPEMEAKFLQRLEELSRYKSQVSAAFEKGKNSAQVRIRYIHDIDFLTPENFRPEDLLISVEQRMSPSLKRGLFSYLTGESKFRLRKQPYRIYRYKGPLDEISQLYTYLVNGDYRRHDMHLTIDHPRQALFLFNTNKSIWLRVTPHEYAREDRLHIHLHKALPFQYTVDGETKKDRILLNLSIPMAEPKYFPSGDKRADLFRWFIDQPIKQLKAIPHMTVVEKF